MRRESDPSMMLGLVLILIALVPVLVMAAWIAWMWLA